MEKLENLNIVSVIILRAPEDIMINRILERAKFSGREDDMDIEIIKKRFENYRN